MNRLINYYQGFNQTPSGKVNIEGITRLKSSFHTTSILFFVISSILIAINIFLLCLALFNSAPIELILLLIIYIVFITFNITICIIAGIIARSISKGLSFDVSPYLPIYKQKNKKTAQTQQVFDDINFDTATEMQTICDCGEPYDNTSKFCKSCGKKIY